MKGRIVCVGTGPGDPDLLTIGALRAIRKSDIVFVPAKSAEESAAYRIAVKAAPELAEKETVPLGIPMKKDAAGRKEEYARVAAVIEERLEEGLEAVYLVLGDPSVYSTFSYIGPLLEEDGFETEVLSGVTSFCAAATRAKIPLAKMDGGIRVITADALIEEPESLDDRRGTIVIMKAGKKAGQLKRLLEKRGRKAVMIEAAGMETERIYSDRAEFPDEAGYYSTIICPASEE